jgi:hypothetical protein
MPKYQEQRNELIKKKIHNLLLTKELPEISIENSAFFSFLGQQDLAPLRYQPIFFSDEEKFQNFEIPLIDSLFFANDDDGWVSQYLIDLTLKRKEQDGSLGISDENRIAEWSFFPSDTQFLLLIPVTVLSHPIGWLVTPLADATQAETIFHNYFSSFTNISSLMLFHYLLEYFSYARLKTIFDPNELVSLYCKEICRWLNPKQLLIKPEKGEGKLNKFSNINASESFLFSLKLATGCQLEFTKSALVLPVQNQRKFIHKLDSHANREKQLNDVLTSIFANLYQIWELHHIELRPFTELKKAVDVVGNFVPKLEPFLATNELLQDAVKNLNLKMQAIDIQQEPLENAFYFDEEKGMWVIYFEFKKVGLKSTDTKLKGLYLIWVLLDNPNKKFTFEELEDFYNLWSDKTTLGNLPSKDNEVLEKAMRSKEERIVLETKDDLKKCLSLDKKQMTIDEEVVYWQQLMGFNRKLQLLVNKREYGKSYTTCKNNVDRLRQEMEESPNYDAAFSEIKAGEYPIAEAIYKEYNPLPKKRELVKETIKAAFKGTINKFKSDILKNFFRGSNTVKGTIDLRQHTPYFYDDQIYPETKWVTENPNK